METPRRRQRSHVWDSFILVSAKLVRCLICSEELTYWDNTSAMIRHLRAKHPAVSAQPAPPAEVQTAKNGEITKSSSNIFQAPPSFPRNPMETFQRFEPHPKKVRKLGRIHSTLPEDDMYHFALSLVPTLRRLNLRSQTQAKIKILCMLDELEQQQLQQEMGQGDLMQQWQLEGNPSHAWAPSPLHRSPPPTLTSNTGEANLAFTTRVSSVMETLVSAAVFEVTKALERGLTESQTQSSVTKRQLDRSRSEVTWTGEAGNGEIALHKDTIIESEPRRPRLQAVDVPMYIKQEEDQDFHKVAPISHKSFQDLLSSGMCSKRARPDPEEPPHRTAYDLHEFMGQRQSSTCHTPPTKDTEDTVSNDELS